MSSSTQLVVRDTIFAKLGVDFSERMLEKKINLFTDHYYTASSLEETIKIILENFDSATLSPYNKYTKYIIMDDALITLTDGNDRCSVNYMATKEVADKLSSIVTHVPKLANVNWYYIKDKSIHFDQFPLKYDNPPIDEMYPFIETSMNEYFDSYMNSSASILLLIGPPGTGKTTFLRGLLSYVGKDAMMTYDEHLLKDDDFFIQFIKNYSSFLIIEDADTMIRPRDEGNTLVSRFLNLSDGIMDINRKKIIFTTNLDSMDKIDPALTREGRCFDVLHFRHLHYEEAMKLANKCDIEFDPPSRTGEYAISEIFNKKRNNTPKQRVGFI